MASDFKTGPRIKDPELLRRFRLEMHGTLCWDCDMRPGIHVHHRKFRGRGGDDVPENLVWLCGSCHDEAHNIRSVW